MYGGVIDIILRYWSAYGGTAALLRSPYFHIAIIALGLTEHYWTTCEWWKQPLLILPNLLGFSLGGLAILLSFGDPNFQKFLAKKNDSSSTEPSEFLLVSASLVHFMILQLAALFMAIIFEALHFNADWPASLRPFVKFGTLVFSGFSYLLFLYSITAMAAAVFSVFRMTSWFEKFQNSLQKKP